MADIQAIHECLFCSQTFATAVAKDDHILDHFARETCVECDRSLIRIGDSLYVKHDASICSVRVSKCETMAKPHHAPASFRDDYSQSVEIKIEQQDLVDEPNESIDFDVLNKLDNVSSATSEDDDNHSIASNVEMKLQGMLCKAESRTDSEQTVDNVTDSMDNAEPNTTTNEHIECKEPFKAPRKRIRTNCPANEGVECDTCGHITRKKSNLLIHILGKHVPGYKLRCRICSQIFMSRLSMNSSKHSCKRQSKPKTNLRKNCSTECDICGRKLATIYTLEKHKILKHSEPGVIFCSDCAKIFSTVGERDAHLLECRRKIRREFTNLKKTPTKQFECIICKKMYTHKLGLKKHTILKHEPNPDKRTCRTCSSIFSKEKNLRDHRCTGKKPNPAYLRDRIPCEECGKIVSRGAMKTHQLAFHSPGTNLCRCCYKVFASADDLNSHRNQCQTKLKRDAESPCDVCHKVLANPRALIRHKISLHSEGIIFCRTCVKKFNTIDELNRHKVECTLKRLNYKNKTK